MLHAFGAGGRARSAAHQSQRLAHSNVSVAAPFVDEMHERWNKDPESVHPSWDVYFRNTDITGPEEGWSYSTKVLNWIRRYQVAGHRTADLDPLGLCPRADPVTAGLDPAVHGLTELDRPVSLAELTFENVQNLLKYADINKDGETTVRELTTTLAAAYCDKIGYEYMHIRDREKCNFIRATVEAPKKPYTKQQRLQILDRLAYSELFEAFLAKKWTATKRFGLEGLTAMCPGMKTMIDTATSLGVTNITMGMPHRGRLNVLANVVRKPMELIFKEFTGAHKPEKGGYSGSGDVKYHLGTSYNREYPDGRKIHMSLLANPSHLEAANPVVAGQTKAKMFYRNDHSGDQCMAVLIHGDAAFAGQGIVYETMQLSQLKGYGTGGTIHIIANNQVGFTTDPSSARSTEYCSALGLTFEAPIFHVNSDYPEEVCRAFDLATRYRQKFKADVIIDLIGYRKAGHQELDNPDYTQPLMYRKIKTMKTTLENHIERLVKEGAVTQAECDAIVVNVENNLQLNFDNSHNYQVPNNAWLANSWTGFVTQMEKSAVQFTGVPRELLDKIAAGLTNFPPNFKMHRQLDKIFEAKRKSLETGTGIDWGTAEALAFGTLLQQGVHVRLSGQDVERGTFSHRHALVHDQMTNESYVPLNHIEGNQAEFSVFNSPLSEYGVLGFELGYSQVHPQSLVIWEAQFGDFVNSAQTIIDQFISAGEAKWLRQTGLVLTLPHGFDGQGPEHSSARLERFLEMCDEDADVVPEMNAEVRMQIQKSNWQVVNPSTPANYFHVLRRQLCRKFRKPLIVMAPKNLLRLRECASSLEEMTGDKKFRRVIHEQYSGELLPDKQIRRVCFCSGKLYYELLAGRRAKEVKDVALVRIEQLSPFPFDHVAFVMAKYPNAESVWVQEEPKNMGAWVYVSDRIMTATQVLNKKESRPGYVGRRTMSAPAEGSAYQHAKNQALIIDTALSTGVSEFK